MFAKRDFKNQVMFQETRVTKNKHNGSKDHFLKM